MYKLILSCFILLTSFMVACPVDLDASYEVCDGDTLLLDSNGDPSYNYQWFLNGVLISGANSPTLMVSEGGTYQVDATNGATNCSDSTVVSYNAVPVDTGFFEMILCDDMLNGSSDTDGISTFDLTSRVTEITNGDVSLTVTWYISAADEMNDLPIADPTQFQNTSNPDEVYYRVENFTGCKYVKNFSLAVNPLPSPQAPAPLITCDIDGDGFSTFDLNSKDVEIANGEPGLTIGYYATLFDAEIGDPLNALVSPYTNIVPFSQIVYARVSNELIFGLYCFRVVELELIVNPIPDEPDLSFVDPIIVSDTNGDGIETFDLTVNNPAIYGSQDPSDFSSILFYITQTDAENQINPIANPTAFVSAGQTIFPLLQFVVSGCYRISPFNIVVEGVPINTPPDDLFIDEGDLNGLAIFDLTVNEIQMLGPLDPSIHAFSYHINATDATNNENAIVNPAAYQNVTNPQTIYVRLTNTSSGAYAIASFVIETDGVLGLDASVLDSFKMFPNPTSDVVFISSEILNTVDVAVYDLNGRKLLSQTFSETTTLPISNLAAGVYYVIFTSGTTNTVKQLIKN